MQKLRQNHELIQIDGVGLKEAPNEKAKVLFGSIGWQQGLIDVASWAKRQGTADPCVFQIQPGEQNTEELNQALRKIAKNLGKEGNHFFSGGMPSKVNEAIKAVGTDFIKKIADFNPNIIGFAVQAGNLEDAKKRIDAVRLFSEAFVVLGGPSPTVAPVEVLQVSGADFAFAGEAEETFSVFARQIGDRRRGREFSSSDWDVFANLPGLAYTQGSNVYANRLPRDNYGRTVLDTGEFEAGEKMRLLMADRPMFPEELMHYNPLDFSILENFKADLDGVLVVDGRGCPGLCTFCERLHGRVHRAKTARELMDDLLAADKLIREGKIAVQTRKLFAFCENSKHKDQQVIDMGLLDEDFFLDRNRAIEFFKLWKASGLNGKYRLNVQTNPKTLLKDGKPDEELFEWIGRLSAHINLGAESFDGKTLARWNKRHNPKELQTVLKALDGTLQDYNIYLILSDHETTPGEYAKTLCDIREACREHERMIIYPSERVTPYFGTDVRSSLENTGRLDRLSAEKYSSFDKDFDRLGDPLVNDMIKKSVGYMTVLRYAPASKDLGSLKWWVDISLSQSLIGVLDVVKGELTKGIKESAPEDKIRGLEEIWRMIYSTNINSKKSGAFSDYPEMALQDIIRRAKEEKEAK